MILVGAAGVGLLALLLIVRGRQAGSGVPVVSGSPNFGGADLGGGSFESSGGGSGSFAGISFSDLLDAIKTAIPVPQPINVTPAPINVTVTAPAPTPAPAAPSTPSRSSEPGPSNQPPAEGTKPQGQNWRAPWVQTDDSGRQVAIVMPGRGRVPILDPTTT